MESSDEELCRAVAERKPGAFDLLVERYQERAYRIAWSVVRDREEARDCSQEAFLRLHESAGSFAGQSKFSTWFYRILVNLCLDHKRKHKWWKLWVRDDDDDRAETILDRQPAPVNDPVDKLSREETLKALGSAVDRLAPRQRAAVLLRVQEDMATYDIARVLKCSEATVRVHLHRALATLKKTVEKR